MTNDFMTKIRRCSMCNKDILIKKENLSDEDLTQWSEIYKCEPIFLSCYIGFKPWCEQCLRSMQKALKNLNQ